MATSKIASSVLQPKYDDALTFDVGALSTHENELIGIKSSLSSSSSTSSTTSSSGTSSSSSQNSLDGHRRFLNSQSSLAKKNEPQKVQKVNEYHCEITDLICPLCKKQLNEPKLLNCLHVFCKQCLIDGMHSISENGDSASSISCPKCKQETIVYDSIDQLQDDCIIHNMLDMLAIEARSLNCNSCNFSEKAEARCANCVQYLCDACIKAHQYMRCFEGHRVVRFQEIKETYKKNLALNNDERKNTNERGAIDYGVPIHKPLFCKTHTKESLKFFCNTCQIPICTECVVNIHTQPMHQYERLDDAQSKNIKDLEFLIEKSKEKINECHGDLTQNLDKHMSLLQENFMLCKNNIEETFQAYEKVLEKQKSNLMKELEEKNSNKECFILEMHNGIDHSVNQLNDLVKFVQRCLVNGNCSEILMLKNLIVNQLRYLTEHLPAVHEIDSGLKFHSERNQFEQAVCSTFGRLISDKEMNQKLLNNLTTEINNPQQAHQVDKSLQNQTQQQHQDWLISNILKYQQQHQQMNRYSNYMFNDENVQQNISRRPASRNSLTSPSGSLTNDWLRNIVKAGTETHTLDEHQSSQQMFIQQNQLSTSLSPQSSNSSNTYTSSSTVNSNSNPWGPCSNIPFVPSHQPKQHQLMQGKTSFYTNNIGYPLSFAQQQLMMNSIQKNLARSNSPIDFQSAGNMNQIQQNPSRSNTPNFFMTNSNVNGQNSNHNLNTNMDEFMPFGQNCTNNSMAQNFNQLSKMIGPQSNLNEITSNMNELALATNTFSEIQSNSSQSPPGQQLLANIGTIGSGISQMVSGQTNEQSSFAGNGNLNPPVRQSGKMTNMHIRSKFGILGAGKCQFNSPHGFCLGVNEEIIIADTNNHRVHIFSKDGELRCSFGIQGKEDGQMYFPRKVAVIRDSGKIVVCDRGTERSRMQIFSKTGNYLKRISIRYIDIVAGLAITHNGEIIAVDSVSPTVFRISEDGDLIKWFDCSDYMREPSDIAINGREYFVCDFKGHCVVVFNEEGHFMRRIGGENITNFPNGIDVSDAGDVLIGDSHGNRFHVAVFTREGILLSEFECPYVKVSRCCGLKITSEGYIVTLAKNNHHVLILNTLYVS